MPTGYTCDIEKGITFKEYALQCARAFGACASIRDETFDKPIPEKFKQDSYYENKVKEIEDELSFLEKSSDKDLQKIIDKEYDERIKERNNSIIKCKVLKEKYDNMLEEIEKWNPPTKDHIELKNFMKQQIQISYSDCDYEYYENKEINKLSVKLYRYEMKKDLLKDLDYYMNRWKEETKRIENNNKWIKELRESFK